MDDDAGNTDVNAPEGMRLSLPKGYAVTSGILRLRPRAARAWTQFPDDVTRWSLSAP